ncbi:MAG: hypothetical protein JF621_02060 [Streptomyces turgidiscabies]|nr:hypothetical protein [Streptomyces turgidiscabies]
MAALDSEFLTHAAEAAFDLGRSRFRVSALAIATRRIEFTETDGPSAPPVYEEGEPPDSGPEGRRTYDWQPAADAPAWMNMAWLLDDLAAWVDAMAEDHITVTGIDAPEADYCDVLVLDGDSRYRVRIALAGRKSVLDFPGMYLRELFAEGRHRPYLTTHPTWDRPVVDLRAVL